MGVTNRVMLGGMWAKEEAKYPWVAACSEPGCYFVVSARSEKQGTDALSQHKCPYGGDERSYHNGIVQPGSNLHEAVWDMIDSVTDGLMLVKAGIGHMEDKALELKGRASGLSSVIMWLQSPYFNSTRDVSAWALERYRMRTGQREWEPTVGCEGYDPLRGEPSPRWVEKVAEMRRNGVVTTGVSNVAPKSVPAQRPARKAEKELPSEEVQAIKDAWSIPGMDAATIANMFKCSTAQVNALKV